MSDRLLKESDVLKIAFQLPYVVNSAFFDAVKALPSADRPQGEWIPCEKRLPSDGELCLVSVIMDDAPYEIIISDGVTHCYERGWATAWMPLPEPWKEHAK